MICRPIVEFRQTRRISALSRPISRSGYLHGVLCVNDNPLAEGFFSLLTSKKIYSLLYCAGVDVGMSGARSGMFSVWCSASDR
jgi:hypothetical protein